MHPFLSSTPCRRTPLRVIETVIARRRPSLARSKQSPVAPTDHFLETSWGLPRGPRPGPLAMTRYLVAHSSILARGYGDSVMIPWRSWGTGSRGSRPTPNQLRPMATGAPSRRGRRNLAPCRPLCGIAASEDILSLSKERERHPVSDMSDCDKDEGEASTGGASPFSHSPTVNPNLALESALLYR